MSSCEVQFCNKLASMPVRLHRLAWKLSTTAPFKSVYVPATELCSLMITECIPEIKFISASDS